MHGLRHILPQVNGPWLATNTAGCCSGSKSYFLNVSTMTSPVFAS